MSITAANFKISFWSFGLFLACAESDPGELKGRETSIDHIIRKCLDFFSLPQMTGWKWFAEEPLNCPQVTVDRSLMENIHPSKNNESRSLSDDHRVSHFLPKLGKQVKRQKRRQTFVGVERWIRGVEVTTVFRIRNFSDVWALRELLDRGNWKPEALSELGNDWKVGIWKLGTCSELGNPWWGGIWKLGTCSELGNHWWVWIWKLGTWSELGNHWWGGIWKLNCNLVWTGESLVRGDLKILNLVWTGESLVMGDLETWNLVWSGQSLIGGGGGGWTPGPWSELVNHWWGRICKLGEWVIGKWGLENLKLQGPNCGVTGEEWLGNYRRRDYEIHKCDNEPTPKAIVVLVKRPERNFVLKFKRVILLRPFYGWL